MLLKRTIIAFIFVLGFALGTAVNFASATEQAFVQPCPMQDHGMDGPCCKGDCNPAMMGCASHCSVPLGTAGLSTVWKLPVAARERFSAADDAVYDPFIARPLPPIPIA